MSCDVKVAGCNAQTYPSAVQLLCGDGDRTATPSFSDREPETREIDPDSILVAVLRDEVVGAIVAKAATGRVGWIWPPVLASYPTLGVAEAETARRLIAAAVSLLAQSGARLVQALVPDTSDGAKILAANGFVCIAEMVRMEKECSGLAVRSDELRGLEFLPYGSVCEGDFLKVVERTYEASLDCPELDALRPVSEVLESYRTSEPFRPELWLLVRRAGTFVGGVLLAYFPDEKRCELQYMGVVPEARGQSIGRALCLRAIADAKRLGARMLSLSVDVRNHFATNHYRALGFTETERRCVYIRKLEPVASASAE